MERRPRKDPEAQAKIRRLVQLGHEHYLESRHALERMRERRITRMEIKYVLSTGRRERQQDRLDENFRSWKYAVRGRPFDQDKELRVVVLLEKQVLVVTAIDVTR